MLTYLLAFAVAIASIGLYAMTFFLPAFKKEQDLIWSGVGLFYALVLWVCAGQVRGGLLLGQIASVAIIGWLGWQAFGARWAGLSESDKQQAKVLTDIQSKFSQSKFSSFDFGKLGDQAKSLADKAKSSAQSVADKTKEAGGLMDKVKETAQSVTDKTKDVASAGKKNTETYVRKNFQDASAAVSETAEKVAGKVADVADKVVDKADKVVDKAVDNKVVDKAVDNKVVDKAVDNKVVDKR